MSDNEVLVGRLVAERYRVVRRLGAGGMGTVYVALQEPLGREVALKVVRRDLAGDERTLERFRREARSLSQAHHPHIVTLYDFGELSSGALWFAMELVRGENLRQRLVRAGPMPVRKTLTLIRDAASALAAAHALGIVHRDLKPENILLMEAAGEPDFVKIVDFGVAKLTGVEDAAEEQQLTQRGSVVGTPGYIAPEVSLRGVTTDPRSDLYALGVVWFECLTGRAPFRARTATALLMAHALDPVPSMPELVPLPVAGLVQRLLAKAPEDRPESAEELVALLDALPPFDSGATVPRPQSLVEADAKTIEDAERPSRPRPSDPVELPVAATVPTETSVALKPDPPSSPAPDALVSPPRPARPVLVIAAAILAGAVAAAAVVLILLPLLSTTPASHGKDAGPTAAGEEALRPTSAPPIFAPGDAGAKIGEAADAGASASVHDAGLVTNPDAGPKKKPRPPARRDAGPSEHTPDIYE
jgi:serine/threonine protein kinase